MSDRALLPSQPALVAGLRQAVWLTPDGEVETLSLAEAAARIGPDTRPIVCHAPALARRLGRKPFAAFDLLELFAFARPAAFALPTPRGLAEALGAPIPGTPETEAASLVASAGRLLAGLAENPGPDAAAIAWAMARGGWAWGAAVLGALGSTEAAAPGDTASGLRVWNRLPEWQEAPPPPPPGNVPVEAGETEDRLLRLLGPGAEERNEQLDYALSTAAAFAPREHVDEPKLVLAEAGTGVGKTLGYVAPASIWAEKNAGSVWISTFTRNLQRQLDAELDRLCPMPDEKAERVVIRKGRENYFCLLNLEEAVRRLPARGGGDAVALGLMARWALASRDGDMIGGDFPAWLKDLLGRGLTTDLTDTRGECIYSACPHYGKCFIEHTVRRARQADIVVANHALVMVQAALGGGEEGMLPTRYVFDEGHHLFDAADSAFAAHLSGHQTADLRRWLVGAEEGTRSRSRGLKARAGDLIAGDERAETALHEILKAARALPGPAWSQRVGGGATAGPAEAFLALVRQQVYARAADAGSPYSLETETTPPVDGLIEEAGKLEAALARLHRPVTDLIAGLRGQLDADADTLDTATRTRIEALARGLERRALQQTVAWRAMLRDLAGAAEPAAAGEGDGGVESAFVDWFGVERKAGRDIDVGYFRHWIDPTKPFAETVVRPAHGALITSATLCDRPGPDSGDVGEEGWAAAEMRTGVRHLGAPALLVVEPSPFNYRALTRVFTVTDVRRDDTDAVAAAYRELFLAAAGGGLGLFTAISRLRAVHQRIAGPLDEAGLMLLAQHVDAMDTGTLVDIFRAEEDACLLGTDAVRDGVDVPGRSLRLIVFDRVPWPRPDILHRVRKGVFGGRAYDEMLTRLRLKQAFGRLVRRTGDRGVFVMLDRSLPSRLAGAFPDGVEVRRLGLADAVAETRAFLGGGD